MTFTKMHGIGNDFVVVDSTSLQLSDPEYGRLSAAMCDRRFGVGGDGLLLVCPGDRTEFRMRMFNPDGSESEMCGNGIRCFAKYLTDRGMADGPTIPVETGAGTLTLELVSGGEVRVDMGKARTTRADVGMLGDQAAEFRDEPISAAGQTLKGTAVSMGNPHLVFFVDDVDAVPLESWGPAFENHTDFPKRTNVHFIQPVSKDLLRQRTWERGAGVTLACGTGACASAVAAFLTGRAERAVTMSLPGGKLRIEYREDGTVYMTGPAETVFTGTWPDEV
jgi:diaminopimelate epimerase